VPISAACAITYSPANTRTWVIARVAWSTAYADLARQRGHHRASAPAGIDRERARYPLAQLLALVDGFQGFRGPDEVKKLA